MAKDPVVLYLCDRKKCGDMCPNPECIYTYYVEHAVNFKRYDDKGIYFVEGGWEIEEERK